MEIKKARTLSNHPLITCPQAGLVDIFLGLSVLTLGIGILIGLPWLVLIYLGTVVVFWQPTQAWIAALCLGQWDQSVELRRQAEETFILCFSLGFALLMLIVLSLSIVPSNRLPPGINRWLQQNIEILALVSGAILITSIGWLLHALHFFTYTLLILASLSARFLFNLSFDLMLMSVGCVMVFGGVYLFIKLTQTYEVSLNPKKGEN